MGNLTFSGKTQKLLMARYNEPHRHYHNLNHLKHCFEQFARFLVESGPDRVGMGITKQPLDNYRGGMTAEQHNEIRLMLWFHDAVYSTDQKDYSQNEGRSALLFLDTFKLKFGAIQNTTAGTIYDGILYSSQHTKTHAGLTKTQQIFLDLDLSGMGGDYEAFLANGEAIRKEFSWVDDNTFLENRIKFFNELLERESIYYQPVSRRLYEDKTRGNISRWISEN